MMTFEAIIHEQTRDFIYPLERSKLAVRLKTKRGDALSCKLVYWNRHKYKTEGKFQVLMECYARDMYYDYYEAIIDTQEATRYIKYYFEINDGYNVLWLNYYGVVCSIPEDGLFEYLYTNEKDIFKVPDWVKESIFYQIFPERFYNGDKDNDPKDVVVWGSKPTRENFMGGDIKGIFNKIDYLKYLGINALYLTPIFEAPSNHKYDTVDYFKIDSNFGNLEDFKALVNKLHENGIKVILDGVFNHIGYFSQQFQDVLKNGRNSVFKDWFYIEDFPVDTEKINYECVGYYKWMPKLKIGNQKVRDYILKIARYWIETVDIDGWRLDVADEIDFTFWHEFRKLVKSIKPECFIVAETWKENRDMLRGDQMDSVMNYLFRDALVDFFAQERITTIEFDSRINRFLGVYPKQVHYSLFNLIGSHDTARFLTLCKGNIEKLKLASAFQMCFIGVPVIYYGDEIGLEGDNDPGCRGAMEWDKVAQVCELLKWYKKLINLRKTKPALISGTFKSIYCSNINSVYGFLRELEDERVYVVLNNSQSQTEIVLPVKESVENSSIFVDEISGNSYKIGEINEDSFYNADVIYYKGTLKIKLGPYQVCIISKQP